jgi:hypothetical protein
LQELPSLQQQQQQQQHLQHALHEVQHEVQPQHCQLQQRLLLPLPVRGGWRRWHCCSWCPLSTRALLLLLLLPVHRLSTVLLLLLLLHSAVLIAHMFHLVAHLL